MRICREGYPFIIGCLVLGALFTFLARSHSSNLLGLLAGVAFLLAAFCAYFFRDPQREIPQDKGLILSPADGKILEIADESQGGGPSQKVIRIFLSVFEPHLQRAPLDGTVQSIRYQPGKFLDARDPRAAFENEQNRIELSLAAGPARGTITVTQIAGLVARRIVCWVREGQTLQAGERLGLIRFGSQVDITLPQTAKVRVQAGDFVKAGESVLGEL